MLHTHPSIYHPHCIIFSPSTSVSPVSTIPPLLHIHPSIYHPQCIMFFSQYFSFPCLYPSTIASHSSILLTPTLYNFFFSQYFIFSCQYHSTIVPYSSIHLPPKLYNALLPALQFPLSVTCHHYSILIHPSTTLTV